MRLRNTYSGLFAQDDWKVGSSTTLNLGIRWDYDSEFPNRRNISPRLGVAWSPNAKTVLSASWGVFYDHFRLGIARDVPGFGGDAIGVRQDILFPRLFHGVPSAGVLPYGKFCVSPDLTDAEIAASGAACDDPSLQLYGIDHLNGVVAPGHAQMPPNTIVTRSTVTALTGLTADDFADAASASVGRPPGFFYWGYLGDLAAGLVGHDFGNGAHTYRPPVTVAPEFRTPFTRSFHVGVQREVRNGFAAHGDYFFKDIRNILGVRLSNLAFEARLPGRTNETVAGTGDQPISTYGPWYSGRYQAVLGGIRTRAGLVLFDATYTYAHATDNLLRADLDSRPLPQFLAFGSATDSFVGVPPLVTDAVTGQTNANGSFVAGNGNPVPRAGRFYNGPDFDRGPSDSAYTHIVAANGLVHLPWAVEASAIFRAQSGFHYSRSLPFVSNWPDVDGDGNPESIDFTAGRNHFVAPPFVNLDARLSKSFRFGNRGRLEGMIEFFNVFNRANPSAVQDAADAPVPFGTVLQVLPGREGQVGLRVEF